MSLKLKFIFLILIKTSIIYSSIDYCTTRTNPNEPNDCVYFSTETQKCCFNPNNKEKCVLYSSTETGLLCNEDFLYNFDKSEESYTQYEDEPGYCVFTFEDIKGSFKYNEIIIKSFQIQEIKGLILKCNQSSSRLITYNIFALFFFLIFIF